MLSTYTYPEYAYRRPPELDGATPQRRPVVVVGAGPVGLATAIDLAQSGLPVLLLDDDKTVSVGSRGLCYAKRTLEILDRLGCGDAVVDKGVGWSVGRTFHRDAEVFSFDLLPEADHRRPGMVNLQQYYLEQYLVQRAQQLRNLELRWLNKVVDVKPDDRGVALTVETTEGRYTIDCDWFVVADGARSPVRRMLGLDIEGKVFKDRFLIADVVMKADFPAERWFWFDPPFHPNQSVLLHREADNVWRIDFQLGWDADPEEEKKPERVIPRIQAMLGKQHAFDLEWVSVYTFQCRRMQKFRHGRALFVGDAAHQVSPFGARGANSGIQDADNLCWKLALVIEGKAPHTLLDSYSDERVAAADENLLNSTRSTDFITPKSSVSKDFRNAVLTLAADYPFARALVNSGRLSVPTHLGSSALNTRDVEIFEGTMHPGAPIDDAPVRPGAGAGRAVAPNSDWLLAHTGGRFVLMIFVDRPVLDADQQAMARALADGPAQAPGRPEGGQTPSGGSERGGAIPVHTLVVSAHDGSSSLFMNGAAPEGCAHVVDTKGLVAKRFDAHPGTAYLLRPDQHVAARWRRPNLDDVRRALARVTLQH